MTINTTNLREQAQSDHHQGSTELLNELKKIAPADLHQVDPKIFLKLSPTQRQHVFSKLASQKRHTSPKKQSHQNHLQNRNSNRLRIRWNALPIFLRSQFLSTAAALTLSTVLAFGFIYRFEFASQLLTPKLLSVYSERWPACDRLTPSTDGCVYQVRRKLTIKDAARLLAVDPTELANLNKHLNPNSTLTPNEQIIIWRGEIPLKD